MKEYIVKAEELGSAHDYFAELFNAKELIRCKDCKHWQCDDDESYCEELGIFNTDMNSYCSYAKRKEE